MGWASITDGNIHHLNFVGDIAYLTDGDFCYHLSVVSLFNVEFSENCFITYFAD